MSHAIEPVQSLSEAWLRTLQYTAAQKNGRAVHVVATVTQPGVEIDGVRTTIDAFLNEHGCQSVETVAETIFPASLYTPPPFDWAPGIAKDKEAELDEAATRLYDAYLDILPLVVSVHANRRGTYFGRMITYPGREVGGVNQLDARVRRLRSEANAGRRTNNTLDMDLAADALDDSFLPGLQEYSENDNRTRGFPCLTHIDFTLHEGRLHALAVYRHQYLVEKAYGNLVGLSSLMSFLSQQTGCELGELAMHATFADAQRSTFASRDIAELAASASLQVGR